MLSNQPKRNKYFVSFVVGYFPALHKFAPYQNYYLYPSIVAHECGYAPIVIIKEGHDILRNDPNLPEYVTVLEYKNIFWFIYLLTKYSLARSVFYINNHQPQSYFALVYTKVLLRKNIFMGHIQPKRTSLLRQKVFNFALCFTARVRLNNQSEVNFLLAQGFKEEKLYIVPIAVNTQSFFLEKTDYATRRDIVYYGNMTTQKGIPTLLEAFSLVKKSISDVKFHIVGGTGNYDPETDIKKYQLSDSVILHGEYRHGLELNKLLNQFKVFVISTKAEGQCMAVYESALAGNALCLPNIMSFGEVFKVKALFHELGDAQTLANNIMAYLGDTRLVEEDNQACRDMIETEYNEQIVKKEFLGLLTF